MCGAGLLVATFHMKIERKKQIPFLFGPELGNTKISDLNGFCNNNELMTPSLLSTNYQNLFQQNNRQFMMCIHNTLLVNCRLPGHPTHQSLLIVFLFL